MNETDKENEIVMYIVVRNDIGMSPGKVAAQVGHGVELAMAKAKRWTPHWLPDDPPCTKVVLGANGQEFLDLSARLVVSHDFYNWHVVIVDEGRTEIEPNTTTVIAFVPMPRYKAQEYTSKLKRYK